MLTADEISSLVRRELVHITDPALFNRIRELLVTPYPVERDSDYGHIGERFTCWTVLEHQQSNTAIAYCEQGFGPSLGALYFYLVNKWGLEWMAVGSQHWNHPCVKAWRGMAEIQRTTKSREAENLSVTACFRHPWFKQPHAVSCTRLWPLSGLAS